MGSPDYRVLLSQAGFSPADALAQEQGQAQQKPADPQDPQAPANSPPVLTPHIPAPDDQKKTETQTLTEVTVTGTSTSEERANAIRIMKRDLSAENIRPPEADDAKLLNGIIDDLRAKAPGAIQEAKNQPQRPEIVIYDGDYNAAGYISDSRNYTSIVISSQMLADLREHPDELKAVIAHEYSHLIIAQNPEIMDKYHPRDPYKTSDELSTLRHDEDKVKATEQDKTAGRDKYIDEAMADDISIRLTRDPEAFQAAMKRVAPVINKAFEQTVQQTADDEIRAQEKLAHHPLDESQKKDIRKRTQLRGKISDPHPSDKLRSQQAGIESYELGITQETFLQKLAHFIEEWTHLHQHPETENHKSRKDAHPQPQGPQPQDPQSQDHFMQKPLTTPNPDAGNDPSAGLHHFGASPSSSR